MKIILSRKGFDSSYGGCPSPVLPNKTMISMPIPGGNDNGLKYSDIKYKETSYKTIWDNLYPKHNTDTPYCHLDPDIRSVTRKEHIDNWVKAFGQTDKAQRHLKNNGVDVGDLFLFFGWFRKTDENFTYLPKEYDKHIIYGYLQIGKIITGDKIKNYPWHPHAQGNYGIDNTLYVASNELKINDIHTGLPGAGTFRYDESLVLTKEGCSRSKWELNSEWNIDEFFENNFISYHSKNSVKDGYFQSVYRGQEFVISENDKVTQWAYNLIRKQKLD